MSSRTELRTFTPPQIAKLWQVGPDKVLAWIKSGQLPAANISNGQRPRYRITELDMLTFHNSLSDFNVSRAKPRRRRSYKGTQYV